MSKRKMGIETMEINKKFIDFEEASKYAKRLRYHINYVCKKKGYQATVMTVVSNTKKGVSNTIYVSGGKKGRPKKELVINEYLSAKLYNGNCITDYHIHVLFVSKPSKILVNYIKEYVDKRWFNIPNIREKDLDSSILNKKKVYKKTLIILLKIIIVSI